jgi:hypothetical protein
MLGIGDLGHRRDVVWPGEPTTTREGESNQREGPYRSIRRSIRRRAEDLVVIEFKWLPTYNV